MKLKKALSAAVGGIMSLSFVFSGAGFSPVTLTQAQADTKDAEGQGAYANPVYDAATDTTKWTYVYFGSYPQSEVTGEQLTEAITGAVYKDDVAEVDGVKYARLNRKNAAYYNKDDVVEGAFYEWEDSSTYHYFKYEPIKWRVLKSEDDKVMLMADQAIDCMSYLEMDNHKMSWYTSNVRSWLNDYPGTNNSSGKDYVGDGFLTEAFTEDEKKALVGTVIKTEDNNYWGKTVSGMPDSNVSDSSITDKLFILSAEEAVNQEYGFAPDESIPSKTRQMKVTDYAFANGTWVGPAGELQGNCWWLLRTPGDHERKTSIGYRDGRVYKEGYYASKSTPYYGVVPVCYVSADSAVLVEASDDSKTDTNPEAPVSPQPETSAAPSTGDAVTPEAVSLLGDVDNNGSVDLGDAQLALKMALKIEPSDDAGKVKAADVDKSGTVDLTDASLILKRALKIIDKFPVEAEASETPAVSAAPTTMPTSTPEEPSESPTAAPSQEPLVQPEDNASGNIWIAGDSIAAEHQNSDLNRRATLGWGVIFNKYFDTSKVTVHNTALSSRSSKSYTQEPQYEEIMNGMQKGDYLLISFGHNDEFPTVERHTDPYGASTDEGSYKWYLKNYYIDPAIRKGAIPVLISSVVERNFVDGVFHYQFHSVYRDAMKQLVEEYAQQGITIPYVDLHSKMNDLYVQLGDEQSKLLHAVYWYNDEDTIDNTHFTLAGARYATKYILEGFKALNLDIMKYENTDMTATLENIATPDSFKIGDLDEKITEQKPQVPLPEEPEDPTVPSTGDAVTTPSAVTPSAVE